MTKFNYYKRANGYNSWVEMDNSLSDDANEIIESHENEIFETFMTAIVVNGTRKVKDDEGNTIIAFDCSGNKMTATYYRKGRAYRRVGAECLSDFMNVTEWMDTTMWAMCEAAA